MRSNASKERCMRPSASRPPLRGLCGVLLVATAVALACVPPPPVRPPAPETADHVARVALRSAAASAVLSATSGWRLYAENGALISAPGRGERLTAIARGSGIILVDAQGREQRQGGAVIVRSVDGNGFLTLDGRRFRGEFTVYPADNGVMVVNVVPLEEYLRGVVPLEIGPRGAHERAAVEAQAITARSYARVRLRPASATRYDLLANVTHQVYGGADAETPVADEAIRATRGLVLTYAGRIVDAVYHSTCGGTTAGASEVWRSADQPYLRPVSDRIPGTDRHYCDISPRFRWTRVITNSELTGLLARYLSTYAEVGAGGPGTARRAEQDGHTASGWVRALVVTTDRGRYVLRGNDMRFVLRDAGGAILGSTYFSLENEMAGGTLSRLTLLGAGFGHGVGMCQWGAIGRARAGQNVETILGTYYPGTRVERVS
jgi:stage II sporulation protein D